MKVGLAKLGPAPLRCPASAQAATAARLKKPCSAAAISARTGSPDTTTSIIVSEVWVWPRDAMCCTRLPAAAG